MAERNADNMTNPAGVTQNYSATKPPQYIYPAGGRASGTAPVLNPAYTAWLKQQQAIQAKPATPKAPTPAASAPGHKIEYHFDSHNVPHPFDTVTGQYTDGFNPAADGAGGNPGGGVATGPSPYAQMTKYEEAQIALQREQLAAQQAQQAAAEKLGASTLIENSNNQYRQDRLKDYYGTLGGRAFDSPKGAPVFQKAPESQTMKDAYSLTGQQDPWATGAAPYAGYTGSSQMNAQHPNLSGPYDNPPVPTSGTGSQIPIPPKSMAMGGTIPEISANGPIPSPSSVTSGVPPAYGGGGEIPGSTGQPQLIMAHGGEEITPAPGTPMPTLLGSPGGKPFSNPMDPNDPATQGAPQGGGDIKSVISNLIQAVQAVLARPEFADLQAPIAGPPDGSAGGPPPPSMATGGIIPTAGATQSTGVGVLPNTGATQSPINASPMPAQPTNQSPAVGQTGVQGMAQQSPLAQPNLIHAAPQTIVNGPGVMNHVPYGRSLTGLGGQGAGMTANGTPVPLSGWQLANMDPSSIADYQSYVGSIAGWNPADLKQVGTSTTQPSGMPTLGAPKNFIPIQIQGGPGGG